MKFATGAKDRGKEQETNEGKAKELTIWVKQRGKEKGRSLGGGGTNNKAIKQIIKLLKSLLFFLTNEKPFIKSKLFLFYSVNSLLFF